MGTRNGGKFKRTQWPPVASYLLTVILVGSVLLVRQSLSEAIGDRPLMILFVIPILVSAYVGGWKTGMLATTLAALSTAHFRSPPDFLINPARPEDRVQWAVLWLTGSLASLLVEMLIRARAKSEAMEREVGYINTLVNHAVNIAGFGVFDHDHRTNTIHWSPEMRRICGWGSNEPVTFESFVERIPIEEREKISLAIRRAHDPTGDGTYNMDHRLFHSDSSERWVRTQSKTFFEGDGPNRIPVRTIGVLTDITDSKGKEKSLLDSKDFVQGVLDISPVLLSLFDLNLQKTLFVSQQITKILGFTQEEMNSYDEIVPKFAHPEDIPLIMSYQEKLKLLPPGESAQITFRWRHKDGSYRHLLTRGIPFKRDINGITTQVVSATSDITELKNMEAELKKALDALTKEKSKLEQSNKELEQFAGVAAHDLRSPIKSIHSWVEMLDVSLPKPRSNERIDQAIEFIKFNTKKAADLIEDLLEVARVNIAIQHFESVDLNKTVSHVLTVLQKEAEAAAAEINCDPLPSVNGTPSCLECLFSNLIRNALTYRNNNRRARIAIGCREIENAYEFFVKDNGIGIEPEYTSQIFEMFKRLHGGTEYPGTGIGLALCKKVVELSNGKIWVDSIPGEGSTFFFTYPKNWGGGG